MPSKRVAVIVVLVMEVIAVHAVVVHRCRCHGGEEQGEERGEDSEHKLSVVVGRQENRSLEYVGTYLESRWRNVAGRKGKNRERNQFTSLAIPLFALSKKIMVHPTMNLSE